YLSLRNPKETCSSRNSKIVALGLRTVMCGLAVIEPSPHRHPADSRVGHGTDTDPGHTYPK
ncbi:hypothetical protein J6590_103902, partial [Homalodisca vitripennis]